ncbi:MAG: 16S rRNA (cytidine(1402)-2'-O)-methyltransferase [Armatimonadetes bacterium]|nr:MAG: 16S rRNA (cytidine(1402)-2'-O)-methyltransferase [Armatimonadota bacterium]
MGKLFIVPTPIGNLKDITLRALEILQNVDAVICEDSRRTGLLLNHFAIKKPLIILNDYNESRVSPGLLARLEQEENMALVSDAGTPLVSDPGYKLVREALVKKITIDSLPGPNSILTALTLSGLPPDKFFFLGYLPEKPGKRLEFLKSLHIVHNTVHTSFIAFTAPHKLIKTLQDFQEVFENIEITLAKELTKIHQSVKKQTIQQWLKEFQQHPPKGEYVLLFNLSGYLTDSKLTDGIDSSG